MGRVPARLFYRRLLATSIDVLIALALCFLLSNGRVGYFFASRAVVMLRIGSPDTLWKGPIPMILGILGPFVYVLPLSILLVLLTEPLTGTSPGKLWLGLKVVPNDHAQVFSKRLWLRFVVKASPFWGMVVALLSGSWVLALFSVVLGVALLANMVLSLFCSIGTAHEVWSQTSVATSRQS
jgi:uncharacterized RDD family membrane protein YckC